MQFRDETVGAESADAIREADVEILDADQFQERSLRVGRRDDVVGLYDLTTSELQLKLNVISETQKALANASEEEIKCTDWTKIGSELRHIADKFSDFDAPAGGNSDANTVGVDLDEPDVRRSNNRRNNNMARANTNSHEIDLISTVNGMLPFAVPQSLWSALVSYAAWKIFKKFQ